MFGSRSAATMGRAQASAAASDPEEVIALNGASTTSLISIAAPTSEGGT